MKQQKHWDRNIIIHHSWWSYALSVARGGASTDFPSGPYISNVQQILYLKLEHTHPQHTFTNGLWKATSRWWFEPEKILLVKTGNFPNLDKSYEDTKSFWILTNKNESYNSLFHQSSWSYHGNPPKNHSFCQKKETASRQGACGKAPLNMAHLLSLGVFILHFLPVPRSRPAFCSRSLSKIPAARVERCDGLLLGDGWSWSCRSLCLILEVGYFVGTCVSHGVFEKQLADITPIFI